MANVVPLTLTYGSVLFVNRVDGEAEEFESQARNMPVRLALDAASAHSISPPSNPPKFPLKLSLVTKTVLGEPCVVVVVDAVVVVVVADVLLVLLNKVVVDVLLDPIVFDSVVGAIAVVSVPLVLLNKVAVDMPLDDMAVPPVCAVKLPVPVTVAVAAEETGVEVIIGENDIVIEADVVVGAEVVVVGGGVIGDNKKRTRLTKKFRDRSHTKRMNSITAAGRANTRAAKRRSNNATKEGKEDMGKNCWERPMSSSLNEPPRN